MVRRVPYLPGAPLVWRRSLKCNGVVVQAGDPVDPSIGEHKMSALYRTRKVEFAPEPVEEKEKPAIPMGSSLLDDLDIEEAEEILSAAMGELSAESWNALPEEARDELVLLAVPADESRPEDNPEREDSPESGAESPVEEADVPERESPAE